MEQLKERLYVGMEGNGITGDIADELYLKLKAFANYGFPGVALGVVRLPGLCVAWIKYTSRRRSVQRCSMRSRWVSGRRTRWSEMPVDTA